MSQRQYNNRVAALTTAHFDEQEAPVKARWERAHATVRANEDVGDASTMVFADEEVMTEWITIDADATVEDYR